MSSEIIKAEKEISAILMRLEKETGQIVENISLEDLDVTTCGDDAQQLLRRATVTLKRLPGTRWDYELVAS